MRLSIILDEVATEKYLKLSAIKTEAEVNEECEPSGPTVFINISPVFGSEAYMMDGNRIVELGDATVSLLEE